MKINKEIQEKINEFAKKQSKLYLDAAEMTYMEKLKQKANNTKNKFYKKIVKFKNNSQQSKDYENDMIIYMTDYIKDLIENGLSEEEAFIKASKELKLSSESELSNDLNEKINEKYIEYYKNKTPYEHETIGLFYGGFCTVFLTIGALIGFFLSGGIKEFFNEGYIYTLIGLVSGSIIGAGFGQFSQAILNIKNKNKNKF